MNWCGICSIGWLTGTIAASGFVGDVNNQGDRQQWRLLNPDPNVSTNVVNRNTRSVRYFIAADAYSPTNIVAEMNAVRVSFDQWQSIPGVHLKFEDAGIVPAGMDINSFDHTNIVYWAKTSTIVNGGQDDISGHLGVCFTGFFEDNTLLGADVVLNAVENAWYADYAISNSSAVFIESVVLHELGHFIGVTHSPVGGATMLFHGDTGVNSQTGLSVDEIAFAHALYPQTGIASTLGYLKGQVTKNGSPVLGAAVYLEDTNSAVVAGTVTRAGGLYEIPAVPPGNYQVRATPLDPYQGERLVAGPDIDYFEFFDADVNFLPGTNRPVALTAGTTNTLNLAVANGTPPFRIGYLREPTTQPLSFTISAVPIVLYPGQSNLTLGVFSSSLPSSGITLQVTGPGITHGQTTLHPKNDPFGGLAGVSVVVNVAASAPPGLRSLIVTRVSDGYKAYANGFVEIRASIPDFNFDGLDDRYQRQHFARFTSPEAAPTADPDQDTMNNQAEYVAGTVPTNRASILKLESVTQNITGTTIRWRSVPGKRYQVFTRPQVAGQPWSAIGSTVTASASTAEYFDAGATGDMKFYRVQVLP